MTNLYRQLGRLHIEDCFFSFVVRRLKSNGIVFRTRHQSSGMNYFNFYCSHLPYIQDQRLSGLAINSLVWDQSLEKGYSSFFFIYSICYSRHWAATPCNTCIHLSLSLLTNKLIIDLLQLLILTKIRGNVYMVTCLISCVELKCSIL